MNKSIWRSNFVFFIVYFLYWIALSWFDRAVFMISNWSKFDDKKDVFYAYLYGLRLDASLTSYLLVIPFLFFTVQHLILKRTVSPWLLRIYTFVPTFLFAAITLINTPLYESWGEKISRRAIMLGFGTIGGVSSSVDAGMVIQGLIMLFCFFCLAHFFYHWFVVKVAKYTPQSFSTTLWTLFIGASLLFAMIRGSFGRATLNPSAVYFSDNNPSNHLAVNTYWAFLKDMTKSTKKNPYQFMDDATADSLLHSVLPTSQDSVYNILNTDRPNVVLILLEGMVGQIFEDLGGEADVTPHMKTIMAEGVNFTRAYSAADRSDKGMIAVMSGFPAQGTESIIKYIPKHEKLKAIGQIYDSLDYSTSFYHGGQSEFYNFKSYMFTHGINRVVDNANFGLNLKRNSWGVYDHVVAARMLNDLSKEEKPFFNVFYTLVNHEPFELDGGYKFGKATKGDAYRSTSFYTDTMFNSFIEKAKNTAWYANTIFVVVSDHGSYYPTQKFGLENPNRFHIPLFLFGGALKEEFKGKVINDVVSQLDVATTLWQFVSDEPSPFKYSTGLFTKNRSHIAFYNSNNTFGMITNSHSISYDMQGKAINFVDGIKSDVQQDSLINVAKAYYQEVFKDFQSY